jgi:hypothetical protein
MTPLPAAVLDTNALWPVGSRIRVWFLDGDAAAQSLVEATVVKWSQYGNVSFEFFRKRPAEGSHIRVSFSGYDGSMLGAQPLTLTSEPTVRLPSVVSSRLSLKYKKRLILHEFGHVLGFEHEFRHPHWPYGKPWLQHQEARCRQLLNEIATQAASKVDCHKINQPLSADTALWVPFDDTSIMNYPIEARWLENRDLAIETSFNLSTWDKLAMTLAYPFASSIDDQQVYFYNQCLDTVIVHWNNSQQTAGLSVGPERLTLKHLELSEPVAAAVSDLQFYAYDRLGRVQWRSNNRANPMVSIHFNGLRRGAARIVFYCDQ